MNVNVGKLLNGFPILDRATFDAMMTAALNNAASGEQGDGPTFLNGLRAFNVDMTNSKQFPGLKTDDSAYFGMYNFSYASLEGAIFSRPRTALVWVEPENIGGQN